jgi:hypothetical protein
MALTRTHQNGVLQSLPVLYVLSKQKMSDDEQILGDDVSEDDIFERVPTKQERFGEFRIDSYIRTRCLGAVRKAVPALSLIFACFKNCSFVPSVDAATVRRFCCCILFYGIIAKRRTERGILMARKFKARGIPCKKPCTLITS